MGGPPPLRLIIRDVRVMPDLGFLSSSELEYVTDLVAMHQPFHGLTHLRLGLDGGHHFLIRSWAEPFRLPSRATPGGALTTNVPCSCTRVVQV